MSILVLPDCEYCVAITGPVVTMCITSPSLVLKVRKSPATCKECVSFTPVLDLNTVTFVPLAAAMTHEETMVYKLDLYLLLWQKHNRMNPNGLLILNPMPKMH